jgi:hypothetical protein
MNNMINKERLLRMGTSAVAALLLAFGLIGTALAQTGDGDGFDGDELWFPLALVALVVVGLIAIMIARRRTGPQSRE